MSKSFDRQNLPLGLLCQSDCTRLPDHTGCPLQIPRKCRCTEGQISGRCGHPEIEIRIHTPLRTTETCIAGYELPSAVAHIRQRQIGPQRVRIVRPPEPQNASAIRSAIAPADVGSRKIGRIGLATGKDVVQCICAARAGIGEEPSCVRRSIRAVPRPERVLVEIQIDLDRAGPEILRLPQSLGQRPTGDGRQGNGRRRTIQCRSGRRRGGCRRRRRSWRRSRSWSWRRRGRAVDPTTAAACAQQRAGCQKAATKMVIHCYPHPESTGAIGRQHAPWSISLRRRDQINLS